MLTLNIEFFPIKSFLLMLKIKFLTDYISPILFILSHDKNMNCFRQKVEGSNEIFWQ